MNLGMRYQLHECTTTSLHHILMSGIWRLVKHYSSSKGVFDLEELNPWSDSQATAQ